jgi:hypothetical protein
VAKATYPWRDRRSLAQVLADTRPWLARKRIIEKGGGGCPGSILTVAEKRLKRPLPPELREFFFAVRPVKIFAEPGPSDFGFYRPEQPELQWHSLSQWPPQPDWIRAEGLAIGQSLYGDLLLWVTGHRTHPSGCIVVNDHELAMGDLPNPVIARSLSEFIAKVVHVKGLTPGNLDDDLDDDDEDIDGLGGLDEDDPFGLVASELFNQEYAELNPTSTKYRR